MKVQPIIFSPTGGTRKAAEILANVLGEVQEPLDLSNRAFSGAELTEDCLAVIAMPSYGGRAPKVAIDRLKTIRGGGAKAVVMAVYGNREQEDTLLEMADAAQESGFVPVAGVAAIAEHSIAHQYGAGRPDEADKLQLETFGGEIKKALDSAPAAAPKIPGNRPYKKAGGGLVPSAGSECVSCGQCAKQCPVGAIPQDNPKKTEKDVCIGCMRCVAVCPQHARKVNELMVKTVSLALKKACSQRKENQLFL